MTKTIPQTPQGKTPAAPQKRRRKKFYRVKFIDSSDVICIANNSTPAMNFPRTRIVTVLPSFRFG